MTGRNTPARRHRATGADAPTGVSTGEPRPGAGTAVTFASMGSPLYDRASHGPYIAEVSRRLQARDVQATLLDTPSPDGRRDAALLLCPVPEAFPAPVPEEALLSWDEENGWSLAFRDPGTGIAGVAFREGLRVLPAPDDVAAWAVVLLAHPGVTVSRDRPAFRDHAVHDPGFEHELARYAAGS